MGRHSLPVLEAPETALLPLVESPDVSPIASPHNLGHGAVHALVEADLHDENADYFAATAAPDLARESRTHAAEGYKRSQRMLTDVRTTLAKTANTTLAEAYLQPFLGDAFAHARRRGLRHRSITEWLADGAQGATDDQLYQFLQGHLKYLSREQNNLELNLEIAAAKSRYVQGVRQAVRQGRYSPSALDTLERAEATAVLMGDIWDTHIMGRQAYYMPGKNYVVVGQPVGAAVHDWRTHIHHAVLHELDHVHFARSNDEPQWQREAAAEHNALANMYGQYDKINPSLRTYDSGVYADERHLDDTLLCHGRRPIDPMLRSRAHTSPPGSPERREYQSALAKNWFPGVIDWIDQRLAQHKQEYQAFGTLPPEAEHKAFQQVEGELFRGEWRERQSETRRMHRRAVPKHFSRH